MNNALSFAIKLKNNPWIMKLMLSFSSIFIVSLFKYQLSDFYWVLSRPLYIAKPKTEICANTVLKAKRLRSFDLERSYPKHALKSQIEGKITMLLSINPKGNVENVSVVNSQPAGVFDASAAKVASKLVFVPSYNNCQPVASQYGMTLVYKLAD